MTTPTLRWMDAQGTGRVYLLSGDQTLIGRKSDAEIVLTDPHVSRQHARIVRGDEGFTLIDMGSRYGTYVNGCRIDRHQLTHGDRIRLGNGREELRYSVGDPDVTVISDPLRLDDLEKSLESLKHPSSSELEKISCILDFHYHWGSSFPPERTFEHLLASALKISGAERGFILLKQQAEFQYAVGLDGRGWPLSQSDFKTSQSVVRQVASEGKAVFMTQGIADDFAQQQSIVSMNLRAVACLPLEAISSRSDTPEVLGILYLDSTKKMHSLSGLDQKILIKLAEEAGNVFAKLEMIKSLEERRRLEQELALAQETQRSLLPKSLPQFENFRIHAFSQPTRYVGGDFYDFLQLSSGELVGVLADVSGKGISAALLSSLLQGALHMQFRSGAPAEEVLNQLNRMLCERSQPERFVTLFLFLLNSQGMGRFVSAGHNPGLLFRTATGEVEALQSNGLILGAFDFVSYTSHPLCLRQGDTLLVYSDGLTEAESPEKSMFGEDRLVEIVKRHGQAGADMLQGKILEALEEFTQGIGQTDDITFTLVEKFE